VTTQAGARIAARVRIHGRVQGVWFRAWTMQEARRLGLGGWVRNRRDGTVEAEFAGPPDAVEAMVAACHDGPPLAKVARVDRQPGSDESAAEFRELPTA
jgi:acylphosphatase